MTPKIDRTFGRYRLVLDITLGTLIGVEPYPVEDLENPTKNILMNILINNYNPYPWRLM